MRPKGSAHRTSRVMTVRDAHQARRPGLKVQALGRRLGARATDDFFLPGQTTPVQINRIGKSPDDVAFAITTGGNSSNVLRAVKVARDRKLVTVGMTGKTGGKLRNAVDHCICIPSDQTPRIQEAHILTGHILCELIEETLFEKN